MWVGYAMRASLPQVSGTLRVQGLSSPVRVRRDEHGVPTIAAANVDDLIFAQGFVTAQDRLWQMDMLRRHVSGSMAEVLGSGLIEHDRLQRYLQLLQSAARALPVLPRDQQHFLEQYAAGVNAEIAATRAHLPVEFGILGYEPEPWTALDSLLVGYALVQDLSTGYPEKLNREAVEALLPPYLSSDLYPVGSIRDHPPIPAQRSKRKREQVSDDESYAALREPAHMEDLRRFSGPERCEDCRAGSNNWVVSGSHTQTGKPLLANDPHLTLAVPGVW